MEKRTYAVVLVILMFSGLVSVNADFSYNRNSLTNLEPISAASSDPSNPYRNLVVVGFQNNVYFNALSIQSRFNIPFLRMDLDGQFAVFGPLSDPDSFIQAIQTNLFVNYAVRDQAVTCMCGGGAPPPFHLGASPGSLKMTGPSISSTITVTAQNGFTGTINLAAYPTPSNLAGLSAQLSPTTVSVTNSTTTATSTLTISATGIPPGGYYVTTVGNGGGYSTSVTVYVNIPDPNDPSFAKQWGPPDLILPLAWNTTIGTKKLIVAVVDSGIDLSHPDLKGNLWTNPADGSHGYNVIANNNDPSDDFGHGTAVAGILSAVINNGIGVAGIAQEQIMAVKAQDAFGSGSQDQGASGIYWAVDHGARIINLSFGASAGTPMLQNAVNHASAKGVLLIAAAGNEAANTVDYPAGYDSVIAVSAYDVNHNLWTGSNYGSKVELSAPGVNIYTTMWVGNTRMGQNCFQQIYCYLSGTSMSTPFVSGVAALAWDYYLNQRAEGKMTPQVMRDALDVYAGCMGTASGSGPIPEVNTARTCWNQYFGYGKLNANYLLQSIMLGSFFLHVTATWQFFSSSGPEKPAKVYVQDLNAKTVLANWQQVGDCCSNELLFVVPLGHEVNVQYTSCFNDSANTVRLDHIAGTSGAPSSSTNVGDFSMVPMDAYWNGIYIIVLGC